MSVTIIPAKSKVPIKPAANAAHTIVIGAGPAGMRTAQELSRHGQIVTIFNAEPWEPYSRVKLSSLLADDVQLGRVFVDKNFPGPGEVTLHNGVTIIDIDSVANTVTDDKGQIYHFDKLVIATGSRAYLPPVIEGIDHENVYALRDMDDAQKLMQLSMTSSKAVVIGGGLLGLEAARGLLNRDVHVTVVEHEARLMPRQLNDKASELLKEKIEALGVTVLTETLVEAINANGKIRSVKVKDSLKGDIYDIPVDIIVVCTGVRANLELPREIGLKFNRGILVNDRMQSSHPDIYAVGECAQHNEFVAGLVGPSFEQAITCAQNIAGETAEYKGSKPCTKLKVLGAEVFSMGEFENLELDGNVTQHEFSDIENGIYRCLFIDRGKIRGALAVGSWPEASAVQDAVIKEKSFNFRLARRFRKSGIIWGKQDEDVSAMPESAIICNCTGITKGAITNSVALGAATLEDIRAATGANTVCGSCAFLVQGLLDVDGPAPAAKFWRYIIAASVVAGSLAGATLLFPGVSLAQTFSTDDLMRDMWFSNHYKIYSGFTLFALTFMAAILGLRKRVPFLAGLGSFDMWRAVHLGIGILCGLILFVHTGFRTGANLNFYLALSFLVTLIFGVFAGLATGSEHKLRDGGLIKRENKPRSLSNWIHILALWPLPVLILIHVLTVYSY